jgi:hypothetical protein
MRDQPGFFHDPDQKRPIDPQRRAIWRWCPGAERHYIGNILISIWFLCAVKAHYPQRCQQPTQHTGRPSGRARPWPNPTCTAPYYQQNALKQVEQAHLMARKITLCPLQVKSGVLGPSLRCWLYSPTRIGLQQTTGHLGTLVNSFILTGHARRLASSGSRGPTSGICVREPITEIGTSDRISGRWN